MPRKLGSTGIVECEAIKKVLSSLYDVQALIRSYLGSSVKRRREEKREGPLYTTRVKEKRSFLLNHSLFIRMTHIYSFIPQYLFSSQVMMSSQPICKEIYLSHFLKRSKYEDTQKLNGGVCTLLYKERACYWTLFRLQI